MDNGLKEWTGKGRGGLRGGTRWLATLLLAVCWLAGAAGSAWAVELQIPALKARAGKEIRIPLMIDQVENLAGVKLILHYDKGLLTFRGGSKTQETQSLMHIINDKTPGKLIIVMAGAKGIQGKDLTIMTLAFTVKEGLADSLRTAIEIPEVQLMGDDLKEIECKVKAAPLTLLP